MVKKFHCMSVIKLCTLILIIIGCLHLFLRRQYPDIKKVDSFFIEYRSLSNEQQKIDSLKVFLGTFKNPMNISDDECLQYFLNILETEYLLHEDESILIAIDQIEIDSGFANFVCSFYQQIKETETFKCRYLENPINRPKIERCVGISFSEEELQDNE